MNKFLRTEIFEKFKKNAFIQSAKIEFTNFEKGYGELDVPKIVLLLGGDDSTKLWADICKKRGTIGFEKDVKENADAGTKWQAIASGDKWEIIVTISESCKFTINFMSKANKNGYAIEIKDGGKHWDHGLWKGGVADGEWKTKLDDNK